MAIFRAKEIAQFSDDELKENKEKLELELIQNYGKVSAGGAPENPGKIREVRRTIARIQTEQSKRKQQA